MMHQENEFSEVSPEFVLTCSSPSLWRTLTSAIQTLSEDATFEVDADGLRTRSMDPSHVALLDVRFPSSSFDKFRCPKPTRFTVHLEDFSKIVRRADLRETVEVSRSSSRALSIRIGSGHYRKEFELHLIDSDLKSSPLPKLTFTSRFSMSLQAFQQILSDISVVSTHVAISVSNGSLTISGKGDSGRAEITLDEEDGSLLQEALVDGGSQTQSRAVYNLEYLIKITKAVSSFADYVKMEYSSKMPLRLDFVSAEKRSQAPLQFYLAPKMTD
jgi:proliferating cell nuclear antigen